MPIQEFKGTVQPEKTGRIDLFVRTLIDISRSKIDRLFENECIHLNENLCDNPSTRVVEGDQVVVRYDEHQGYSEKKRPWSDRAFSILHEDDHILVVNKAAAVLTVPTNRNEPNTLLERVSAYLSRKKKNHAAGLIHRLDRDVSGVMVFAKTPDAARSLRTEFNGDTATRIMIAIVLGVVEDDDGTLDSFLDTHSNLNRYSTDDHAQGQHAVTRFHVLRRLNDTTVLRLELATARRHQARVQLFELGHKILGDRRYGADESDHPRWKKKRLALHSSTLSFQHPESAERITFNCVLPASMKRIAGNIEI